MKIAISGKGGVGKTTLASGLARLWSGQGKRVIAIDADPDANLAVALGANAETAESCVPLAKMDDLIEERTGARPGAGGMFRLNPDVSDVVDTCGVDVDGITLLRLGTVERGGAGCMCSEGTFLKAFMRHLLVERGDVAILDMEAGLEHLGRGTAESVDVFVVVVEPGARAIQTAHQVAQLADDIGVGLVVAVGSKVRDPQDAAFLAGALGEMPLVGAVPDSDSVRLADREGRSAWGDDPAITHAIEAIADELERLVATRTHG